MAVLVILENWDGKFKKQTFEIVTFAVRIAELIDDQLIALSLGKVEASELKRIADYGAEKVLSIENETINVFDEQVFTSIIANIALENGAKFLIFSNNIFGKALAPRLSVKLKAGLVSGVNKLPVSKIPFIVSKKVYSGKAIANICMNTEIKILTLMQNSIEPVQSPKPFVHKILDIEFDSNLLNINVKEVSKQTGKILISDAEIVIAGGRGMKSPENWGPLVELAELLGAATACSRPVSDEGWRPHEEHTGQTGKIIAPNLYFAFGISGATQHLAGISSSKIIIAVNTDKEAPIFEAAQYGIVGDAMIVLPKLVEAVKEIKSN
jgi:electron transfer flavoprotein alpha subunit